MNKIWLIIRREYLTRVKKRSFIIMTFLGPLLFAGLILAAALIGTSDTTIHHVLIADDKGWLVDDAVLRYMDVGQDRPHFKNSEKLSYDFRKGMVDAKAEVENGAYTAVVQLDSISYTDGTCIFTYDKVPSLIVQQQIQSELEVTLEQWRVNKLNISWEDYKRVKKPVTFINKDASTGEEDMSNSKAVVGFGFAIVIYLFIFLYGIQVMRGVIEEKTSRIVEVIVSSVRPFQLMMGKVIGIGLVGLTQFLMWVTLTSVLSTVGLSVYAARMEKDQMAALVQTGMTEGNLPINDTAILGDGASPGADLFSQVPWLLTIPWTDVILTFIFFFIGGYLLYGSLFAAVGAAVDQETDTQQFMMPITLPLIFAYFISVMIIQNPESPVGTVFSIIPLTSPVVIMVKTCIGVPIWLKLLSMGCLVIAFVFFIWLAARIYRVGILMYGKKPTYRELWKWIRYNP